MKYTITGLMALALLAGASCRKGSSSSPDTWSWRDTSYSTSSVTTNGGFLIAATSSTNDPTTLSVIFYNATLPVSGGIDTVVAGAPTRATQVEISLAAAGNFYSSTGGNGHNQTVNVGISGGNVTVATISGTPVELLNITTGSGDSSGITFSIIQ